eukprot:TRINITY_DN2870_c1_g1_i2.p1 TRINITY_DN2870_c1_g1~~TRINITY_DN2870_c1_g1_i2.p1  ORF type:complete len:101 (-),score=7.34 TRINITY_DN2870_c1_g1_i2:43-345(-)
MKSITLAVFDKLVKYSWKNKLVIALLAFAVNYGELYLLWKQDATNPLTKYVNQLKLLLEISYFSHDKTPVFEDQIPTAVYWAVKGIVACSSQSIALVNLQ